MSANDSDIRRIGWWVQTAWPNQLRALRSAVAAEIVEPPAPPDTDEVERAIGATRARQHLVVIDSTR